MKGKRENGGAGMWTEKKGKRKEKEKRKAACRLLSDMVLIIFLRENGVLFGLFESLLSFFFPDVFSTSGFQDKVLVCVV